MASQASSSQTISLQPHQQQLHQPVGFKEPLLYKNRLQEFAQREKIEMPVYQTQNEGGTQHAPRYKSTVVVDGKTFTSSATFSNRKAAEQDAAKMALECISNTRKGSVSNKTSDEGFPPISEDRVFCKSILYEFAVKTNSEMPTYNTVQLEGLLPMFVCSVVFNGVTYTGDSSVNKKEAEQLAARAVILSILGNSGSGTILSDIIKAKATLYSTVHKRSCSSDRGVFPVASNSEVCLERASTVGNVIGNAASGALQGQSPVPLQGQSPVSLQGQSPVSLQGLSHVVARHEFKKPGTEEVSQAIELPITFVPSLQVQSSPNELACGGKRKRKSKKKAKKKAKTEIPMNNIAPGYTLLQQAVSGTGRAM